MRFIVLGSSGMLGSELSRVAKHAGLDVVEISRSGSRDVLASAKTTF
jgi:dTDP-4-dehydrorhamnose reductase